MKQLPKGLKLEYLLGATEIYGVLNRYPGTLSTHQEYLLLEKLKSEYLKDLIPYKNYTPVEKIIKSYNTIIRSNSKHSNLFTPIDL